MIYWSFKTLFLELTRTLLTSLAIAFAFVLVIFFKAVFEGESEKIVAYLYDVDADIWVMQKGVENMHMASSMLWDWKADSIRQTDGVRQVSGFLFLNAPVNIAQKDWLSYLIGIKQGDDNLRPKTMAQGRSFPRPGEVVIPEAISRLTGVKLGDVIRIFDRELVIVGLSGNSFSMASSLVFLNYEDLSGLLEARDQYSYLIVTADENTNARELAKTLEEEIDKVNIMLAEDFIQSDWELAIQMGAELITIMTLLGMILAVLISAFASYSLTSRKKRELAVAKALGYSRLSLYTAALCLSLIVISLGLLLALILTFGVLTWLPLVFVQLNLSVKLVHFYPLLLLVLPSAILASLFAANSVVKSDPMTVFK